MGSFKGLLTQHFVQQKVVRLKSDEPALAVPGNTNMYDVIDVLRSENCGAVVVNDENDEVIGIVTERDVLLKPVDWGTSVASDIMTTSPEVIRKSGSIARALHTMSVGGFRHLPIVHRERYVEHVLSVKDVVKHIYDLLLRHHIGEICELAARQTIVHRYFCSSLEIFSLRPHVIENDDVSVHDALQKLKQAKAGGMILVDADKKLSGIFTDRDYIQSIAGRSFSRKEALISSYMTKNPVVGSPDETVHEVYGKLSAGGFRHVPIVDGDKILGMLSIKDFLDLLVQQIIEVLEEHNASSTESKK